MPEPCILVVDDDPAQREGIAEVLELSGYVARTASDGFEALELAAAISPAVILLDLGMPIMTGWEVMAALRRDAALREIPVIVISGELDLPAGVDVIPKPFRIEHLLQRVERVLARPGAARVAPCPADREAESART
jgi:CheY-like chemotaxis protein